jgi:hypothetical protein
VFVASGFGVGAWWRRKQRRASAGGLPYESGLASDPAAELRAKLAESKPAPVEAEAPAGEAAPEPDLSSPSDPEKRRRALHEQARASIDELN